MVRRVFLPGRWQPVLAAPVQRRLFHIGAGSLFPILLLFFDRTPLLVAAGGLLALSLGGEWLRFRHTELNRLFLRWFRPLLKTKEDRSPLASTYVLASTVLVIGSVSQPVAALALFYGSLGDALAALVGERFGAHRLMGKSVEGSGAFLGGSLAIGGLLIATGLDITFSVVLVGAVAAMLIELLPLPLDDNLKVAPGAAGVMALAGLFWA